MNELTTERIAELRSEHYNAELVAFRMVHDDLAIFRVRPDDIGFTFDPGQYTTLGLGVWESRLDGLTITQRKQSKPDQLIRRAYSISWPILNERKQLVCCSDPLFVEFYIALVNKPTDDPPPLTTRLFSLKEGDRLHIGSKARGTYTLAPVQPDDNVIFAATGTGEAPHNAMVSQLLSNKHRGKIATLTCVRQKADLAYLEVHRELEERYNNYKYVPLTTREPENLDESHPGFVGKQYIQDIILHGGFLESTGWEPDPKTTHVFLCGNPSMIGLPSKDEEGNNIFPEKQGTVEILGNLGFKISEPRNPGNIHYEKYW